MFFARFFGCRFTIPEQQICLKTSFHSRCIRIVSLWCECVYVDLSCLSSQKSCHRCCSDVLCKVFWLQVHHPRIEFSTSSEYEAKAKLTRMCFSDKPYFFCNQRDNSTIRWFVLMLNLHNKFTLMCTDPQQKV